MAPSKKFLQPINLLNAASDPSSADRGDFYYNTTSEKIRYYDGTQWNDVGTGTGGGTSIIVSETEPTPTAEGEAWFKSSTSELFIWDGTYWIEATSVVSQLFYVSSTQPNSPQTGSGWLDTTTNSFYIYDGTSWVSASSPDALTEIVQDTTPQLGGDLDGNGFGLDNIDYVDFDTTTTTTPTEGALVWDDGEGTLQLGLKGGNVNLALGQEMVVLCYNGSGSPMSDGDVVYVQGAQGQRPNITLASAASEAGSSKTLGIVTEPIAAGEEGFVTNFGVVNNVNTLGFTEGAALWLSTTAGDYTQTQPQSPNHLVFIGYCLNASETAGRIFVSPQNGYELEELHNVLITSASDNDIVSYESSTGLWKNQNLATAIGEVDGAGSGIDADLLDGQQGTYYLDWTNTTNKPDPTITLGGDLTGSVTLTDLASGTLTAAVVDDSHNHIISNVDGLQTALDGKQPLDGDLTAIAGITGTSGLLKKTAADTWSLDTNTYLTGNQNITLTGDVSGSGTTSINVTVADDSHNHVISNVDGLQTALDAKAPLASPALTGTPTAPTATAGTNTTQIATTAFVQTATAALVDAAPTTLDTLNELAAALGDDPNFATTVSTALGNKQPLDADLTAIAGLAGTSGFLKKTAADTWALDTNTYLTGNQTITLTGDVSGSGTTSISVTVADDSHNHIISNVDGLQTALDAKAPLASPALTGTPTAPTASAATNNTQIATTAYVKSQGYSTTTGTVTSVAMTVPTGLSISGSPITSSGTLAVSLASGYEIPQSSAIVHIAGTETITGAKTFSANTIMNGTIWLDKTSDTVTRAGLMTAGFDPASNFTVGSDPGDGLRNTSFIAKGATRPVIVTLRNIDNSVSFLDLIVDGNTNKFYMQRQNNTPGFTMDLSTFNVGIGTTSPNYKLEVNGSFAATSKSFDIQHPTKENMRLRYGSLESPYHGINLTGESFTKKGICKVELPDYIHGLVKRDGINIQLTNIGHGKVMWIEDIDIENNNFIVKTKSKKECRFFWSLVAIRKDIDDLVVEYEKDNA